MPKNGKQTDLPVGLSFFGHFGRLVPALAEGLQQPDD
jgi:hypothetical protein